MKFQLVDKITELEPDKRIVTIKALSLAEEYLGDHFPTFPVLPGVLMLEAITESAAWLARIKQDFSKSIIVLTAARNVKYTNFVQPGNIMRTEVEVIEIGQDMAKFKGAAYIGDRQTVSGRIELKCSNLGDTQPGMRQADQDIIKQLKDRFRLIGGPEALARAAKV